MHIQIINPTYGHTETYGGTLVVIEQVRLVKGNECPEGCCKKMKKPDNSDSSFDPFCLILILTYITNFENKNLLVHFSD